MESEKLLFYGGSFDPPHMGHHRLLEAAINEIEPDITLVYSKDMKKVQRKLNFYMYN